MLYIVALLCLLMDDSTVLFQSLLIDELQWLEPVFDEESESEIIDLSCRFFAKPSTECRNVLVRYCAHIPRNYHYRDGIRLVSVPYQLLVEQQR